MNPFLLQSRLQQPDVAELSDAQVVALPGFGTPILTPRTERVTITTLASAGMWGFAKAAAAQAAFTTVAAAGGANGASARLLLSILQGTGFDASDPQAAALAPSFIPLSGGALDAADVQRALYTESWVAGEAVTESDVAAARAALARRASVDALRARIFAYLNDVLNVAEADPDAPLTTPKAYFAGDEA